MRLHHNAPFILDEKRKSEIELVLKSLLEREKFFTQVQYNLRKLSSVSNFSTNLLSAFFNQSLGLHFNDYLNQLRVIYCKHLIENGCAIQLTLEGLSKKCGFNNRNTFTTAFKKFTGVTPSTFLKQHGAGLKSSSFNEVTGDR